MSGKNIKKTLPAGRAKRDPWLQKELETLLDQIIIHKEIFVGKHAHNVSQIDKQNMWKEITNVIHQEHPECTEKFIEVVKKKWGNFTSAARTAIRHYNDGLTETGGGSLGHNGVLSSLYYKYYEQILGLDNPSVAATAIPGAVDTDDPLISNESNQLAIMQHIPGRPSSNAVTYGSQEIGNRSQEDEAIEFADLTDVQHNEPENDISLDEGLMEGTSLSTTPMLGQLLAIEDGSESESPFAEIGQALTSKNKDKSLVKKTPHVAKRCNSTPIPKHSILVGTPICVRSNSTDSSSTVDFVPPSATSAFHNLKKRENH